MGKPAFRTNPETGRLEKLINGKYVPQNEMGAWKKGSPLRKFGRLLIREPSPETLAEAKRIREKKSKDAEKKRTWTSGKSLKIADRGKVSYKRDSPKNLKKRFKKDTTSETGPFGGKNPYKDKPAGENFKNPLDLKIGTYKDGKPSADTTSEETKKDKLKTKSSGAFDFSGWSEAKLKKGIAAGGRNSVRKNKMRLALRKKNKGK